MSTGAECAFIYVDGGEWYYVLQRWPYGEWPEYDAYGGFPNRDEAITHLSINHANPGGFQTLYPGSIGYDTWKKRLDRALE